MYEYLDKIKKQKMSIILREDLIERLNAYKTKTGVTKTFVIEKAIERYLNEEERKLR